MKRSSAGSGIESDSHLRRCLKSRVLPAILWVLLNLADVFVSWLGVQAGALEIGFLYRLSAGFWSVSFMRMALAIAVLALLIKFQKAKLLVWLNLGMLLIIAWNVFVYIHQQ